jgi:H+-transporting ATPase
VLLAATAGAAVLASFLAWMGWLMAPLPGWLVLSLYGTSLGYGLTLDAVKVLMLRHVPIDRR